MKLLNILSTIGLLLLLAIAVFQDLHTDKSANEDDTAPAARSPQRHASATSASAFFATTAVPKIRRHVCARCRLAYLGANREAPREYDCSHQSYGKGNVHITLEPRPQEFAALA